MSQTELASSNLLYSLHIIFIIFHLTSVSRREKKVKVETFEIHCAYGFSGLFPGEIAIKCLESPRLPDSFSLSFFFFFLHTSHVNNNLYKTSI